ncbi:MAG: hypothetical protein ISN28_08785, partial [Ectothiorhodospiraceae bacterium AqS1]|nr:hypothetical protein [Ectothiorhodospiraceae bacterium AqS1]
DCHAQADGSAFEGALPEAIPAWGAVTLTAEDIERHTGASWAGKGRLGCALRSQGNISAQVWTRSSDGVLVNNSAFIRSEPEGNEYRADIESIPEPDSAEKSNLRIRCEALEGEACTATRLSPSASGGAGGYHRPPLAGDGSFLRDALERPLHSAGADPNRQRRGLGQQQRERRMMIDPASGVATICMSM